MLAPLLLCAGLLAAAPRRPELVVQLGHQEPVRALALSVDGRLLASSSRSYGAHGEVKIWDLRLGKEILTLPGAADGIVFDGPATLGVATSDRLVLHDLETDAVLHTFQKTGVSAGTCVFNPPLGKGPRLLACGGAAGATLFQRDTAKELRTLGEGAVLGVAFHEEGQTLVLRKAEALELWSLATFTLVRRLELPLKGARLLAVSRLGVAALGDGLSVVLIDLATGVTLRTLRPDEKSSAVAFSVEGDRLAVGVPNAVELYRVADGKVLGRLVGEVVTIPGWLSETCVAFSLDGQSVVVGIKESVHVFDTASLGLVRTLGGKGSLAQRVGFSPGSTLLATWPELGVGEGHLWDLATGRELRPTGGFDRLAISPDERLLALWSSKASDSVTLLDRSLSRVRAVKHTRVTDLAFSPDGALLATASSADLTVRLWSVATGKPLRAFAHHESLWAIAFSPDGKLLASGGDHGLQVWDVASGALLRRIDEPVGNLESREVLFSPDGTLVGRPGGPALYEVATGAARPPPCPPGARRMAFLPGGAELACVRGDGQLELRRIADGATVRTLPIGRGEWIAFGGDGRHLAVSQPDHRVRLLDPRSGDEVASVIAVDLDKDEDFFRHRFWAADSRVEQGVETVMVAPDGSYLSSRRGLTGVAFRLGARALPFDQFDLALNRPDRVLQRFGYATPAVLAGYARLHERRLARAGLSEEQLAATDDLPEIFLREEPPRSSATRRIVLSVHAEDAGADLRRLNLVVNEVPALGAPLPEGIRETTLEVPVELSSGRNKIQLSVVNAHGAESLRETMEIEYTGPKEPARLFVIAVGVSKYRDARFNLTYAAKDARDVVKQLSTKATRFDNGAYARVTALPILDAAATREGVQQAHQLLMGSKVDDVVVLFLAGHGLLDARGDYWFGTSDIDFAAPAERGLGFDAIEAVVSGIPARQRLILMDTCQSGDPDAAPPAAPLKVPEGKVKSRGFVLPKAGPPLRDAVIGLQESFADLRHGSGAAVIASASAAEYAFESPRWNNGVFTYALIKGLRERLDFKVALGPIRVSMLRDYVTELVQKLTAGRQTPAARRESLEFDFAVY